MAQPHTDRPMEASFSMLVMSIASSAAVSMGLSPDPMNQEAKVDKNMARFNIDLLEVLQKKTQGNLTQDEAQFLSSLLTDLRMKFLNLN